MAPTNKPKLHQLNDAETALTNSTDKFPRSDAVYDALGYFKNYIINGAMQVAQEQTSVAIVGDGSAQGEWVCDMIRYYQTSNTGDVTISQDTESPDGFYYSTKPSGDSVS